MCIKTTTIKCYYIHEDEDKDTRQRLRNTMYIGLV